MDIETVDHMKLVTEQRFETRRRKILFTIVTMFSVVALIFVISVVHEELDKTNGFTVGGDSFLRQKSKFKTLFRTLCAREWMRSVLI